MTTWRTLTGRITDHVEAGLRAAVVLVENNLVRGQSLVDLETNTVAMQGSIKVDLNANYEFSIQLIDTAGVGTNIDDGTLRYRVRAFYWDALAEATIPWTSPWFSLTADATLASKVVDEYVDPLIGQSYLELMEAVLDQVEVISGLTGEDETVALLIETLSSGTRSALDVAVGDTVDAAVNTAIAPIVDVMPNGIIEGRALFQYGPSRGVGVTAQRIHFNRLRRRVGSGFWFNGSVAGHQASDTATVMYSNRSTTRQANGENEWALSSGVSTWANRANQGGILIVWPFGNDALNDGRPDRNSTTAKARAGARNALHAIVAMARSEARIESVLQGAYTTTSGSPNITGAQASPWYKGMLVQGTGIPANTYVGDMINGGLGGFKLSSSRTSQADVNATANGTGVTLTFSPTFTGSWTTRVSTEFSGGNMVATNANGATKTYVIHIPAGPARKVHWVTSAIDDAEYTGTKGAPYGGAGGASYSIAVDGGSPVTGTTADEHRFGALDNCFAPKVVTLGPLAAGAHTIEITCTAGSKLLVDDGFLVESPTPPTVLLMKEVELPSAYYALLPTYGASYAKTQIYNGIIDDEVALWPADESVITMDITDHGYDKALHISAADGAYAHFNDAGERLIANVILNRLNQLPSRVGLIWA